LCACAEFPARLHAMLFADEMQNEYALIQEIRNKYSDRKLATTFYPAERILNLYAEIPVSRLSPHDNMEAFDAVILYNPNRGNAPRSTGEKFSVGPYSIIEPKAH